MPKKIRKQEKRHNIYFENDCWEKLVFLKQFLDYNPSYAKIVNRAVLDLFNAEMKQNKNLKLEWQQRSKKRGKIVSINKEKGDA